MIRHLGRLHREAAMVTPDVLAAIRECREGVSRWPLVLSGPVGVGKTCAALVVLDHVASPTAYCRLSWLCEHLIECRAGTVIVETGIGSYPKTVGDVWTDWEEALAVVLDEVGYRDSPSEYQCEVLQRALDMRHGLPLVVATNRTVGELTEMYDSRIGSRLAAGTAIWMDGPDRRLQRT